MIKANKNDDIESYVIQKKAMHQKEFNHSPTDEFEMLKSFFSISRKVLQ